MAKPKKKKPQWGDPIRVGAINNEVVEIREPLNNTALEELSGEQRIILVLCARLSRLEEAFNTLKRDVDMERRVAQLEGAMGVLKGKDDAGGNGG